MNSDPLASIAEIMRQGLSGSEAQARPLLEALFGLRYGKNDYSPSVIRDTLSRSRDSGDERGVPFAALIHPDNPPSGPYGGASVVWFPAGESGSLIGLLVGTRGLSPDEGILTRPGHRRRVDALRRLLARKGLATWTKPDPAALSEPVPKVAQKRFPGFEKAFERYGHEMYCIARVPREESAAREVAQAFLDVYASERGWRILKAYEREYNALDAALRDEYFRIPSEDQVYKLLLRRRFVVLQGPPGTGKTRLAEQIRTQHFGERGMTVQFHPAVTYEDFVVGLSPDPAENSLRFQIRRGWLLEAAQQALEAPFLLVLDEVNRADLGKVLGEAIYLFEPSEVGGERGRRVILPHRVDGEPSFEFPTNLYVIATMNTADRSIAPMDLAVRRRFAFVSMPPERNVVTAQNLTLATEVFDRLADIFIEYVPEDALDLLPGHAYYLAEDEDALRARFQFELLPLLDEYLRQGLLGPAASELHAVRDWIEDAIQSHAST